MDKLQIKEQGIREDYEAMKSDLSSWGDLVDTTILSLLSQNEISESKIQIPPKHRIKTTESLIGRAIYDKTVEFSDPLKGIPDKVGTRIVLTSTRDVTKVIEILKGHTESWKARVSRGPEKHMKNPKEFDYASVHLELIPTQNVPLVSGKTNRQRER
jgi:ppGpp synthetase/RelA/SpoT-type nucleotidyltranferase